MQWKELSALAREMAATPPSDRLHQTKLRLTVSTVYYAMYHALARSNADLLVGPSETEGTHRSGTASTRPWAATPHLS